MLKQQGRNHVFSQDDLPHRAKVRRQGSGDLVFLLEEVDALVHRLEIEIASARDSQIRELKRAKRDLGKARRRIEAASKG